MTTGVQIIERKKTAPYVPASALSEFFDHIRYVQTPKKVDSNLVLDYGAKKSQAFPLISALKFLGLTDDKGTPTPAFRTLQTGGEEFKTALNGIIKNAYSELFGRLDVSRDSRDKIVNYFARNYSPATAERATALFLDLCGEAGIETAAKPRQHEAQKKVERKGGDDREKQPPTEQSLNKGGQTIRGDERPQQTIERVQEISGLPGVSIKIDSKDLAAMNPQQIKELFEGLRQIMSASKEASDK